MFAEINSVPTTASSLQQFLERLGSRASGPLQAPARGEQRAGPRSSTFLPASRRASRNRGGACSGTPVRKCRVVFQ